MALSTLTWQSCFDSWDSAFFITQYIPIPRISAIWWKLASSVSQSLKGPHRWAQGKTPYTTSLLLCSVWEAMFSLRDKAFQGAHVLRDTQMAPLKAWIRHSSQFHNAFLSEGAFSILQVIRMSNTFAPETPTQTLTQKEKHTQNSSLDQTHSKALFFFFWC